MPLKTSSAFSATPAEAIVLPRLLTKLVPPRFRTNLMSRPRLINLLVENQEARLVMISAPAGYGKTTLLSDYVHHHFKPCCWLSFDLSDYDPVVFIENLVLSISRVYPSFNTHSQFLPSLIEALREPINGPEACSRLLVNQIYSQIDEDFELILDDFHIVENHSLLNQLLSCFLNYLPDNCRVLLRLPVFCTTGSDLVGLAGRSSRNWFGRIAPDRRRSLPVTDQNLPASH